LTIHKAKWKKLSDNGYFMISGILLWGTGSPGIAEETSPDLLQKSASSLPNGTLPNGTLPNGTLPNGTLSNGMFDISKLSPWFEFSLVSEGPKSRCWISAKHWDGPLLIMSGNCSSSLDLAWHFHRAGLLPVWGSVLALSQWAGRGQFGRRWQSPPGNIYASWRLPSPPGPWVEMLSLVVGYMVIQGLRNAGIEVQLKWPNDLVIRGKKVGGILIEARGDVFIAGVGINLVSSPEKFQLDDSQALSPTSLKEASGLSASPLALWTRLVQTGKSCYHEIVSSGLAGKFTSYIQPHMAFMGEEVTIDDHHRAGGGLYHARILGLDQSGGLLIRTASGQERIIRSGRIYPLSSLNNDDLEQR
jgi:BirA family biotin operon repressor/biotin-[acetyl-CoA-carboxylase] ligase